MENTQSKQKILVVEDDLPVLRALVDKLTREGFSVLQAKDGAEGLAVALRDRPDLILLDIVMPIMDGLTVMKKLRAENEWSKKVPVIFLTNLSPDAEEINKSITEDEPAYYLMKANWSMADVIEKVRERLNRKV